jgi:hypothetical protein
MSHFENSAAVIESAKADESLRFMAAGIQGRRYSASPDEFERLLWTILSSAMCVGARLAIAELAQEHQARRTQ